MTEAGVWATVVNPHLHPLDQKNRQTALGKSPMVKRSTPKCDVSEVENGKDRPATYQYRENSRFGVDRLTTADYPTAVVWFSRSTVSQPGVDHPDRLLEVAQ